MRYRAGHKEEARARLIAAAGRGFRRKGFGGIGVDGLAKEAEVTSGAFYGHFASKDAAFKQVAVAGLIELREAIENMRAREGAAWLGTFVDFYMGAKRTCDLGETCGLQSLTPEVARADEDTKNAYEAELTKVVDALADGLPVGSLSARRKIAWSILAILSGGVTLARSSPDPKVGVQIANAVKAAVAAIVQQ